MEKSGTFASAVRHGANLLRYGVLQQRPATPRMLLFSVTGRCNLRCRHCDVRSVGYSGEELSIDGLEGVSRDLPGLEELGIGGGEPFLREDLDELCGVFARHNPRLRIGIATNALDVSRTIDGTRRILNRCPNTHLSVNISIDGLQPTHDRIRKRGSFDAAMETATQLVEIASHHPRVHVAFNATLNELNADELPALAQYLRTRFGKDLECNILWGQPNDSTLRIPSREKIASALEGIYAGRASPPASWLRAYSKARVRTIFEGQQVPCRAGSLIALLSANGDVLLCPNFPPLGSVRTQSFANIWNSDRARAEARRIRNGECTCTIDCYLSYSLAHAWQFPLMILREASNI